MFDDDIPAPPNASAPRYPFRAMRPGQSMFFPGRPRDGKQHRAYMAAKGLQKRTGLKFVSEYRTEHGIEGLRIWRVE